VFFKATLELLQVDAAPLDPAYSSYWSIDSRLSSRALPQGVWYAR
jgi:hypothetical protein